MNEATECKFEMRIYIIEVGDTLIEYYEFKSLNGIEFYAILITLID